MSPFVFFSSKTFCVVIFWWQTACVLKAWDWPRGWQMPGPRAVQNLQMPHPRDWQGGKCPAVARGRGGGGAGRRWNWLMPKCSILDKAFRCSWAVNYVAFSGAELTQFTQFRRKQFLLWIIIVGVGSTKQCLLFGCAWSILSKEIHLLKKYR